MRLDKYSNPVFNEVDYMKSVSSRIMAGLCIKGGTGLCNIILDKDLLENSEYTTDIGQLYKKTYEDITIQKQQEIDNYPDVEKIALHYNRASHEEMINMLGFGPVLRTSPFAAT